jgi:Xaa-Pro aminopeptidase
MNRIQKVRNELQKQKADAIFITNFYNIFYLTGFMGISEHEREAALLITAEKAYLFVPEMYEFQAKGSDGVKNNWCEMIVNHERDKLLFSFGEFVGKDCVVLFESSDLKCSELELIKEKTDLNLSPAKGVVEDLREIKDEEEIEVIKKAVEITDKSFLALVDFLRQNDYTQTTELDMVDELRKISRSLGGEGFGFDPIIASGEGSALPHYFTSNKKLTKGSALLFDIGIKYKGYTGDLTRTIYLGKAPDKFKDIYFTVLESNQKSLEACSAQVDTFDLSETAKDVFRQKDLEGYFIHGLGHGVGLEIHEKPSLRCRAGCKLKENMIITIEPGLYFEGEFGVRIEDFVAVKANSCHILSKSPKDLIEID